MSNNGKCHSDPWAVASTLTQALQQNSDCGRSGAAEHCFISQLALIEHTLPGQQTSKEAYFSLRGAGSLSLISV